MGGEIGREWGDAFEESLGAGVEIEWMLSPWLEREV